MVAVRITGHKASLHWLATKNAVLGRMKCITFPTPNKRSPLALSGCEAAKAEQVLRAPFVPTEASFVGHNTALAVLEACAAVTNLFGLE